MEEKYRFLMEEARMMRRHVVARHGHTVLDSKSTMWIIRYDAWRDLLLNASDIFTTIKHGGYQRKELMGIPVRVTIYDEPDVPMIQLVMEPEMKPR